MGNKFIEKITNEVWGKWCSVPIVLMLSIMIGVPTIVEINSKFAYTVTENNRVYSAPTTLAIGLSVVFILCVLGLNIWNLIFVHSCNHIKCARRNRTGILIYVDACDRKIYDDTVRKFGSEFKHNLSTGLEDIYVPYNVKPIEYKNQKIVSLLRRKRCILFLNISINTDLDNNSLLYDMKIDGSIIHPSYMENVEKEFQKVFTSALHKFENVTFLSNEMIKKLRITAEEMSFACEYVIGLSLFFAGNFRQAEERLEALARKCSKDEKWLTLKKSIQIIRHHMFMFFAMVQMEKYQRQCDDELALDEMNVMLEKAKECRGQTFEYCLNKANYCIAKERDAKKAKEYINICKQMKKVPLIWKYSDAFLVAYENRAIGTICSRYNNALSVDYNILNLIVYTEKVLEKEPERVGLHLALGILYRKIPDDILADENLEMYLCKVPDPKKAREILIKKGIYRRKSN